MLRLSSLSFFSLSTVIGLSLGGNALSSEGIALDPSNQQDGAAEAVHGIAMHGRLALAQDFEHLPYGNPDAPKGGTLRQAVVGTFDSLNPFIVRGRSASNLVGLVYESLLQRAYDEPFSLYARVAKSLSVAEDRSWITFHLDPRARFSDGHPLTSEDVVFSMTTLRDLGRPNYRNLYGTVQRVETPDSHTVTFHFDDGGSREAPLLMGLMPILPAHATDLETFQTTSLEPPVGSGPYVVESVDAGRQVVYRRQQNYWAKDIPSVRGLYNFDRFVYEYFRDRNSALTAFRGGLLDTWAVGDHSERDTLIAHGERAKRRIHVSQYPQAIPAGMRAIVMNSRRAPFDRRSVRRAMQLFFDYATVSQVIHGDRLRVTQSYWDRSALSPCGSPASAAERRLLLPFQDVVTQEAMEGVCDHPLAVKEPKKQQRLRRREATQLLTSAGYVVQGGRWIHQRSKEPLTFEAIYTSNHDERIFIAFANALKRNGIDVTLRRVDSAQFTARRTAFDFDMLIHRWYASLSPGTEQRAYWGSAAASTEGSRNYMGVQEPAIDAMIDHLLAATERDDFEAAVRALDRVLLSGAWVIPLFHASGVWLAYADTIESAPQQTNYGYFLESWWAKP